MKFGFALGTLLLLISVAQAKTFEGTVQYQTFSGKGKKGPVLEMAVKGDKIRMESKAGGHEMVNIMDMEARQMTMLMPQQKKYMVHAIPETKESKNPPKGKLGKTGKSESIAGYTAEEWKWTPEKGKAVSFWGTTELGTMMPSLAQGHGKGGPEIPAELKEKGFFPLRMLNEQGGGMEALAVKPGGLSSSLFEVPSGYSEMKGGAPMMGGTEGSARMEEAMKNMSPEQRAAMEKMMKKMGQHAE